MLLKLDQHYQVEFIGLPGAGKSTLANDTIEHFNARGIACYDYDQVFRKSRIANKWLISVFYFLKNFNLFFILLLYTLRSSPARASILRYNLIRFIELLKLIVVLEVYQKRLENPALFIFDQGIIQCLWSVTSMGGAVNQGLLKRALAVKKNILPDLVFHVNVDPLLASRRIGGRNSRCIFDHLETAECSELFNKQEDNYRVLLDAVKNIKTSEVFIVNGNEGNKNNGQNCFEYLYKKIMKDE